MLARGCWRGVGGIPHPDVTSGKFYLRPSPTKNLSLTTLGAPLPPHKGGGVVLGAGVLIGLKVGAAVGVGAIVGVAVGMGV